jgi:hypothetical protein
MVLCSALNQIPWDYYLVDCAVSGGTLRDFLQQALEAAQGRLCVRVYPTAMDFPLPCPSGVGETLAFGAEFPTPSYFSPALCTQYGSYLLEDTLHLVLWDTRETLAKKLQLAESLKIPYALVPPKGKNESAPQEWGA